MFIGIVCYRKGTKYYKEMNSMPNNLVFNTVASQLQAVMNGVDNTGAS